jgi:hypothetical protein
LQSTITNDGRSRNSTDTDTAATTSTPNPSKSSVSITTTILPSLEVTIYLPPTYPLVDAPVLTRLATHSLDPPSSSSSNTAVDTTSYLPPTAHNAFQSHLSTIWRDTADLDGERQPVVWEFLDWIGRAEFVDCLVESGGGMKRLDGGGILCVLGPGSSISKVVPLVS